MRHLTAPAGMGQGSCCGGGPSKGSEQGACEEEMGGKAGRGWGAEGSQEGVECATHVHTCPLLRSAWLEEWEREAEENWLWVVWAGGSILPSHGAHATLVGARHRQPRALVLVALGPQRQREAVSSLTPCYLPCGPQLRRASPGWCQRQTPWCSKCKAGCAWGTQRWHAGPGAAASCGHRICSHSTHSLVGTHLRGSVETPEGLS